MKAPTEILRMGTDYAAGWEAGRNKGRRRSGSGLLDRLPLEHLSEQRADDWKFGYQIGLGARKASSITRASYTDQFGNAVTDRIMSGSHKSIVQRLIDGGCTGYVNGDFLVQTGSGPLHKYGN